MYAPILKKFHDPFSCIINVSERNIIYFWHYCDTIKKSTSFDIANEIILEKTLKLE